MSKDYYSILGVSKSASAEEIKKSFRRLAHEHHPDKGGDAQKFKDINEAYQILGDAQKRGQYDRFGSAAFDPSAGSGFTGGMGGGPQGGFGGFGFDPSGFNINVEDMGDLGDMFGSVFGFGGRGKQKRGEDIQVDVTLDFLDAVKGVHKKIQLYKHDVCSACTGTGAATGSARVSCKTCDGKGSVHRMQRTIFGSVQTTVACSECHGAGSVPEKPCATCEGLGVERRNKEMEVDIPAGISEGEALKIAGEGEFPGVGGHAGDLYLRIRVKSHATFTREGNDILSTIEVPFTTLALGGDVTIATVDGSESLDISAGTAPSTVFKLRGKGVPFLRSRGRGDHHVTVQPIVPRNLSKKQKNALEELRSEGL